jgi:hypothetical protein
MLFLTFFDHLVLNFSLNFSALFSLRLFSPPFYFLCTLPCKNYVLTLQFVNTFLCSNELVSLHNVIKFTWLGVTPICGEHCTVGGLKMYWGLGMKRKTVRFTRFGDVLTMVSGPPGLLPSSVE